MNQKYNNMKTLFEYAILLHPDEKAKVDTILISEPKTCLANNAEHVAMIASRLIPDQYVENLNRISISVRPFKPCYNQIITGTSGNCLTLMDNNFITYTNTNYQTQTFTADEIKTI